MEGKADREVGTATAPAAFNSFSVAADREDVLQRGVDKKRHDFQFFLSCCIECSGKKYAVTLSGTFNSFSVAALLLDLADSVFEVDFQFFLSCCAAQLAPSLERTRQLLLRAAFNSFSVAALGDLEQRDARSGLGLLSILSQLLPGARRSWGSG
jgi:hypothetical protein